MNPARTGEHPSPEEVDAILEPSGGAAGVAEHVESCERCRATRDGLAHVRALLRQESARVPEPPSDLGERITAALGAEPARAGVVPLARARRVPPRWLQVAAGIAVLGAGAAGAAQVAAGGENVSTTAESGLESAPLSAQDSAGSAQGSDGGGAEELAGGSARDPAGGSAEDDVLSGGGSGSLGGGSGELDATREGQAAAAAGPATAAVATGTDYVPSRLPAQVATLVATEPAPDPVAASPGDRSLTDPTRLDGCLQELDAGGTVPVAVDLARWEGTDAAVLVLPAPAGDGYQVWVVARDCGPDSADVMHSERVAS